MLSFFISHFCSAIFIFTAHVCVAVSASNKSSRRNTASGTRHWEKNTYGFRNNKFLKVSNCILLAFSAMKQV